MPTVATVTPAAVTSGGPGLTLEVRGHGFVPASIVRWDGTDRATLVVDETELSVPVLAADIEAADSVAITVVNPPPGGGESEPAAFVVGNPAPRLDSIRPTSVQAGAGPVDVTVHGDGFAPNSVVLWDGEERATTFLDGRRLRATIAASDTDVGGEHDVSVHSPAPGGGGSREIGFTVYNPTPRLRSLSPAYAAEDGAAFTLTVAGADFVPSAIVRWDGAERETAFVSDTLLTASIPASDLARFGAVEVTVVAPGPGGGASAPAPFTVGISELATIDLEANDLIHDPHRKRLYASVGASDAEHANSIAKIDPSSGVIETAVFVGSDPGRLAIADDGQYLYVALDGAAAVRRVDLTSFSAGLEFPVLDGGTLYVEDIEVLPGAPGSVAISRRNRCCSPRHEGVAIYDDGVMRPVTTPGHTGSNVIEFPDSASILYGYNNETTEFGFRRMEVSDSGVVVASTRRGLLDRFGIDIEFADGRIYATDGAVVDPVDETLVATIPARGAMRADPANGRVLFRYGIPQTVSTFSTTTFAALDSLAVPDADGAAGSLVRWGTDGLAFRTNAGILLVRTTLVTR